VFIRAVSVSVTIEHARIEDLEIDITSPDEITVPILWRSGGALDPGESKVNWPSGQEYVFDTQWEFRGKQSSGQWTLTVRDMVSGDTGKLESWRLEIHTYREADESKRGGGILCTNSSRIAVKNSIIWGNAAPTGRGPQAAIGSSEFPSVLKVTYSDIEGGADDVYCGSGPCGSETLVWGEGNIDSDPLFSATQGDYHVKSVYGRWNPASQSWVTDQESSPCLDGGDPSFPPEYEPEPAGFRINMGAYGNTSEASMAKWMLPGDANGDCIVDIRDLIAIKNHLMQSPSTGDLWKYDVNQDNNINVLDLLYVRARLGNECQ